MRGAWLGALALTACAAGPRPVPAGASAAERLAHCEAAVLGARGAKASFDVEARGAHPAQLSGTLELHGGAALRLTAEGSFGGELAQVELDSRDADGTNRQVTKGPSVSGHRDPPAPGLGEALGVGLVRLGLLHNLARLVADEQVDHLEGGVREWVRATEVRDGVVDTSGGQPCHRVEFTIEVAGAPRGEASLCIADATGLPVHRTQKVRFEAGELTVTETLRWSVK